MTLLQLGGCLLVSIVCPILGALPLMDWMLYAITGKHSIKATILVEQGWLARFLVLSIEAIVGIAAVLLVRIFFPSGYFWELVALIGIVMGRYWSGRGGGIIAVLAGVTLHDPTTIALIVLFASIGLAVFRTENARKKLIFVLLGLILSLRQIADAEYVFMAIALTGVLWWSDLKIPTKTAFFEFFSRKNRIFSLDRVEDETKIGRKAANLARLRRWGHAVADGWIVIAGDDLESITRYLQPSREHPLVVRSSIIGKDLDLADKKTFTRSSIFNSQQLETALIDCLTQDDRYRVAAIVQREIHVLYSGSVFSRDPTNPVENTQVVIDFISKKSTNTFRFDPDTICLNFPNDRERIVNAIAILAREIEVIERGIPQQIDWIYDGSRLWIVDMRAIVHLQPLWTRNIIEKIVSRSLRPLTWSIYRTSIALFLSENLTALLGKKVADIDFYKIAILHHSRIYLNTSLLTEILAKLGLSLEEIDRDPEALQISNILAKFFFSWHNFLKLINFCDREWHLDKNFFSDNKTLFAPILRQLASQELQPENMTEIEILSRIEGILLGFNKASYYYLLVSLSLALRQELFKPEITSLDEERSPERVSLKSLASLAAESRKILAAEEITINSCASLFAHLAEVPEGENVLQQLDDWLAKYGYLGEIPSDLATPRWQDNPRPVRDIFTQIFFDPQSVRLDRLSKQNLEQNKSSNWRIKLVQQRLDLKGEIASIYQQLLANLRWSFLALEKKWLRSGLLLQQEDIFLLKFREIQRLIRHPDSKLKAKLAQIIARRRIQIEDDRQLETIPTIVYGYPQKNDISS
jgi:pyruvate, water dikinase